MSRKHRNPVGLIGLGIIGTRVAASLRAAGFPVFVWNRSPRTEPNFLGSAAEIAETCEIVQIFVSDATALFQVIEDMREKLTARHLVICSATVGRDATLDAAEIVHETGAGFLDAPFTGSKVAAENSQLVYLLGGSEEAMLRAEPYLRASAKEIIRIGAIGEAAVVKVATNMLAAVTVQALSETLALVRDAGIDPARLGDVLEHHGVRSGLIDIKFPAMLRRDYEPHFALKHMFKDVNFGIHLAGALATEIPATATTAAVLYSGISRGWGDLDFSAVAKAYEDDAAPLPSLATAAPAEVAPEIVEESDASNQADESDTPEPPADSAGRRWFGR